MISFCFFNFVLRYILCTQNIINFHIISYWIQRTSKHTQKPSHTLAYIQRATCEWAPFIAVRNSIWIEGCIASSVFGLEMKILDRSEVAHIIGLGPSSYPHPAVEYIFRNLSWFEGQKNIKISINFKESSCHVWLDACKRKGYPTQTYTHTHTCSFDIRYWTIYPWVICCQHRVQSSLMLTSLPGVFAVAVVRCLPY